MKSSWGRWGFAAISLLLVFSMIGCTTSSYYVRSAKLHINNKNYAEAEKILEEGAKTPPNDQDPELWYMLGMLNFDKKDWAGMNNAFDKSLALGPKFAEQINKTKYHAWQRIASGAVKEFQGGNFPKAITDFQTALTVRPNDAETLTNLGLSYFKNEQYPEAADAFKQSMAVDSSKLVVATKLNLLETYRLMDKPDDVIKLADDILATADSLDSNRKITVIQAKAIALQKLGKTEDAIGAWDKLIAEDPTNADFVFNKALLLDMLERYDDAAKEYLKAIELNPSDNEARMRASNALLGSQQWPTIVKVLEPWLFPDGVKYYEPEFKDLHTWMTLKAAYANTKETDKMKVVDKILKKISG